MSLPVQAIDRLFARLIGTYGREFMAKWEGVPEQLAKSSWAHELSGFAGRLDAIAWALENLPERAPNAIEFRNLCRRAEVAAPPAPPEPPADPVRLRAELAKLAPLVQQVRGAQWVDGRAWARRIVARHDDGARINAFTLRCAREALRMPIDSGVGHA